MFKSSNKRSTPRLPSLLALTLIGLLVGGAGGWLIGFVGGRWVEKTTVAAADFLMLSDTGPQLGMRKEPADIVIVQYGANSADRLGTKPTVETDEKVYENLLSAGAVAVADPRQIAALLPEDFESSAKPTLEMMSRIDQSRGRLVREVLVSGVLDKSLVEPYRDFISHDPISFRAPVDARHQSRICPLLFHDQFLLRESMAVWLARRHHGLETLTDAETQAAASESGVGGTWLTFYPDASLWFDKVDQEIAENTGNAYRIGDQPVPAFFFESQWGHVSPAGFWIDHSQPADSFPMIDYADVAKGEFDKELIKDKIVLIGLDISFIASESRFELPNQRWQVGNPTLIALAAQTLIKNRVMRFLPHWMYWVAPVLLGLTVTLLVGHGGIRFAILKAISVLTVYLTIATWGYRNSWFTDFAITPAVIVCCAGLAGLTRYLYEVRWRNRMTDLFGRYVPRAVVSDLISKRVLEDVVVGGKRRDVSVMFADIRGFTRFTENNQPEAVLDRLNEFLQVMVDCTLEQGGTIDKFIGDAILVLFNAPVDQNNHAERAVQTAWAIQNRLVDVIEGYEQSELKIGIGIHTGEAIVGTVGTPERMEYTAIGSTVNTASRLCDRAAGGKVVVSQQVVEAVGDRFSWTPNEPMTVKGIDHPLLTATLEGSDNPT